MGMWLKAAKELVKLRQSRLLVSTFVETLKKNLSLDQVLVLFPSSDGRMLEYYNDNTFTWAVSDFNVPFSHVLQNQQAKLLKLEELLYWRDNENFNLLTHSMSKQDSLLIYPMSLNEKQAHSLLVLVGQLNSSVLEHKVMDYIDVFIFQWSFLEEVLKKEQAKIDLSNYLLAANKVTKKNKNLQCLATELIGESEEMKILRNQTINGAETELSILIQGETGTGKELVAQAIHQFSSRNKGNFVAINCAAIPDTLLESELFGYVKGAFSGANKAKQGLIALANDGTLFLDEIGDMPLNLQSKLLRVLEEKSFRPIGSDKEQASNFRLVSATHIALLEKVKIKEFRKDLYYRLLQYPILIPKLQDRKNDIEQLSIHFIKQYNDENSKNIRGLSLRSLDYLNSHTFPGNVRELKHLIQFSCAQTAENTMISVDSLDLKSIESIEVDLDVPIFNSTENNINLDHISDLKKAVRDFENNVIQSRLRKYSGNRTKVAKSLGLPKRTLTYKCQKLEIPE